MPKKTLEKLTMRMRRKKGLEERIENSNLLIPVGYEVMDARKAVAEKCYLDLDSLYKNKGELWLEIGCGKAFILIIPYVICLLYATNRHQQQLLDRLGMNVVNDKTESTDPKLIHLVDSTGRLKMSISIDSLYYVESQDNYVKIYYESDGKLCNYMLRSTTKAIENKFGDWLIRCHRGYIVNKNKIRIFRNDRDGMYIKLTHDGIKQIPVSKSYSLRIQHLLSQSSDRIDE